MSDEIAMEIALKRRRDAAELARRYDFDVATARKASDVAETRALRPFFPRAVAP